MVENTWELSLKSRHQLERTTYQRQFKTQRLYLRAVLKVEIYNLLIKIAKKSIIWFFKMISTLRVTRSGFTLEFKTQEREVKSNSICLISSNRRAYLTRVWKFYHSLKRNLRVKISVGIEVEKIFPIFRTTIGEKAWLIFKDAITHLLSHINSNTTLTQYTLHTLNHIPTMIWWMICQKLKKRSLIMYLGINCVGLLQVIGVTI